MPHRRVPGAGCRVENEEFKSPKKRKPDDEPDRPPARRRQTVPVAPRTTPGKSASSIFRDPGKASEEPEEPQPPPEPGDGEEPPDEQGDMDVGADEGPPEEDPDREKDPVLPPDPGESAAEAKRKAEWHKMPLELRRALLRIHRQVGHLGNQSLIKILKLARASTTAIRGAQFLKCDACTHSKAPQTRGPPASDSWISATSFGDVIYIDLATFWDTQDRPCVVLVVVDVRTSFGMATPGSKAYGGTSLGGLPRLLARMGQGAEGNPR